MAVLNFKLRNFFPVWMILLLVLFLACPAKTGESALPPQEKKVPTEFELKATYLYNFLKFIRWPQKACKLHDGKSHTISVLGESPFNPVLKAMQEKLQQHGKELQLEFYGPYREDLNLDCCCLLFIAESELHHLPSIMEQLAGKPILTVTDNDAFMDQGVMITLVLRDNRIRWVINRTSLDKSGLQLSAKLFDIAVKVIDE